MRTVRIVTLALLLAAAPRVVSAVSWTAGTNLGFSYLTSQGSAGLLVAGWPSQGGIFFGGFEPGIRIGLAGASGQHEGYLDTGLVLASGSGSTLYSLVNTVNYQYNFIGGEVSTPYVTGGIGLEVFGYDGESTNATLLGLGIGGRHLVASGHGAVRTEFRVGLVLPNETGADSITSIGLKFGFDLLMK